MDGKFQREADAEMEVSYDSTSDMVTIEGDLMVPLPVYNYARYIKEACVC